MAKVVKTIVIDMEFPDGMLEQGVPPQGDTFANFKGELVKIISAGCTEHGFSSTIVSPKSRLPVSYSEYVFDLEEQ